MITEYKFKGKSVSGQVKAAIKYIAMTPEEKDRHFDLWAEYSSAPPEDGVRDAWAEASRGSSATTATLHQIVKGPAKWFTKWPAVAAAAMLFLGLGGVLGYSFASNNKVSELALGKADVKLGYLKDKSNILRLGQGIELVLFKDQANSIGAEVRLRGEKESFRFEKWVFPPLPLDPFPPCCGPDDKEWLAALNGIKMTASSSPNTVGQYRRVFIGVTPQRIIQHWDRVLSVLSLFKNSELPQSNSGLANETLDTMDDGQANLSQAQKDNLAKEIVKLGSSLPE